MHTLSPKSAIALQNEMRERVILHDDFKDIKTIAGIDVGYDKKNNLARAALVTMKLDDLKPTRQIVETAPEDFPYIPGLLSFREAPVILKALGHLKTNPPDILFIDGHGIAHPRRLGIAAHIGVLTGLPAIGIAKKKLCGRYTEPGPHKGDHADLWDKNEKIGVVLRSRDNVKPLFISPGHKISHETALNLVAQCLTKYRLPEPTRLADKLSKAPKTLFSL